MIHMDSSVDSPDPMPADTLYFSTFFSFSVCSCFSFQLVTGLIFFRCTQGCLDVKSLILFLASK